MTEVYLALGSNVGDSAAYVKRAAGELGKILSDLKQAPVYASKAVGHTDQPDFLNTAVSGRTGLPPEELLKTIKDIERRLGRVERFRWGPREIDIDIIFYGDKIIKNGDLAIPHPSYSDRDFVLRPLLDLNPSLTDPTTGKTIKELLDQASSSGLHPLS